MYSWFTARTYVSPTVPARPVATEIAPAPAEHAAAPDASLEALQLHDWRARTEDKARRNRDIFAFTRPAPRAPAAAPAPAPAAGLFGAAADGQGALALFKLIGVAEDAGPDGPKRTAIISGQGQLYMVKEGETVAWIYRVGRLSADGVELVDTTGGPPLRLFLK
jgi:hypothetical protein